jgi:excisionase family DNA binding protein
VVLPRPSVLPVLEERFEMSDGKERDELPAVPEVAALLRLTAKGVYALVESRRIPFVRVSNRIRLLRRDVVAWIEGKRVQPGSG